MLSVPSGALCEQNWQLKVQDEAQMDSSGNRMCIGFTTCKLVKKDPYNGLYIYIYNYIQ